MRKRHIKPPSAFTQLVTEHDRKPPVYLRGDVENFHREFADYFNLRQCAVLVEGIVQGSVFITLLVPVSIALKVKSTHASGCSTLFMRNLVSWAIIEVPQSTTLAAAVHQSTSTAVASQSSSTTTVQQFTTVPQSTLTTQSIGPEQSVSPEQFLSPPHLGSLIPRQLPQSVSASAAPQSTSALGLLASALASGLPGAYPGFRAGGCYCHATL